jgi:ABC-2 type transport system permease protein
MKPATTAWIDKGALPARTAVDSRSPGVSYAGALRTLYVLTVRQHLHGKRWMVMGLVFLLPAGLAVLLRATAPDVPPLALEFVLAMMFIPQALLPLVALLYASGMIQDEQEEQTITYLLIRPLPKWALYLVKLLATWTTTVTLTFVFTALTYAAIYLGTEGGPENIASRCLKAAAIHSLSVIAYCSLFGLMSLITRRTLVIGIVYTAVVEGVLANMPFGIRLATVIYYARLIAYHTLPFVATVPPGRVENLAAEAWQLDVAKDPDLLAHPQLTTCLTVLVVGSAVAAILAAWLCTRREFHVKTPEKA